MSAGPSRVLILSASIGEGHDLPARELAAGITSVDPEAEVEIVDSIAVVGGVLERIVVNGSRLDSAWGSRAFDLEYRLLTGLKPTRRLAKTLSGRVAGRRLLPAILARAPDVVVSTYPGSTEALGWLRANGRLEAPAVSAITDLAALDYWAHPAVDLHLITHPESEAEVRSIAPDSRIECVRGLTSATFYEPCSPADARDSLGLTPDGPIVVVSGGGWAVGDLAGAADVALAEPGVGVILLCGRNEAVRSALSERFASEDRAAVWGFTDRMDELLSAADVLIHSTAGLTVLEGLMRGCRVISFGWGRAHVRINNRAFAEHGLAEVAADTGELRAALRRALADPAPADVSYAALPGAAEAVLSLTRRSAAAR